MLSVFDLFRIGIGPSSSHTVGPMRAARRFVEELANKELLADTDAITVDVYGSLALTGKGHGTDRGILLGLAGEDPAEIDTATIDVKVAEIYRKKSIRLLGKHPIEFECEHDLVFRRNETLLRHPNGMRFAAYSWGRQTLASKVFYSVGGGFVFAESEWPSVQKVCAGQVVPYPFHNASELLRLGREHSKPIWTMVLENEKAWRSEREVEEGIVRIWHVMQECAHRGCRTEGVLPGGLNVRRRAPQLYQALQACDTIDPLRVVDWINLFAIAVNEENAAGGRVVTAPTNGAAGVVPAVAHYYQKFVAGANDHGILRYFLTAGGVGILYKTNASISGAEVGCQGEVGVACSMAAGGLVAAMGGTNEQVEHAAEIAMEHSLGMTCDPVAGLVQIPCIERNAIGAAKAVNAARMSMNEKGGHKVSLDQVIKTMYQTGLDMQTRYKETSLAGLAVNVVKC
jgi:L-serine dehydratase